ncbi:MAG: hypothetical protein Q9170_007972, partial [Blastenia crenularia]
SGWSLYWNTLDISRTNVPVAAHQLLTFYTRVLATATPVWSAQAPAKTHGAELGGVQIRFLSEVEIEWEWIRGFLDAAIGMARSAPGDAVVSSYKIAFVNVLRSAPIWVELVLPWAGAAEAA